MQQYGEPKLKSSGPGRLDHHHFAQPASMPSGTQNYQCNPHYDQRQMAAADYIATPPSLVDQSVMDRIVLNISESFDSLLEQYNQDNMFDYEKACKNIFLKGLIQYQSLNMPTLRSKLQTAMNQKYLKFQMKEKELRKAQLKKRKEEDDQQ